MTKKMLIADDEIGLVTLLKNYFEMNDYEVYTAYSGIEVIQKVKIQPDIILLDINMPEMDGFSVCERIRDYISCPILFLTARIQSTDKIKGFSIGADDYILKPFDLDELGARVAAHLRRENRKQVQPTVKFFNDLSIDYSNREVKIGTMLLQLTKKEFDIVELLSINAGQVFDRERIYDLIWGLEGEGNSATIMEHIRKIRGKLLIATPHQYITTVWGVGYKWNG